MIQEYIEIQVGQLLIVDKSFWSSGHKTKSGRKTKMLYAKGDILEIRYPYNWHFRDEFNNYDHASEKTLRNKCSFYGKIKSNVSFENEKTLKLILENKDFHPCSEFELKRKESK